MEIDLHQLANGYQLPKKKWEYMTNEEKLLYWIVFAEKVIAKPQSQEAQELAVALNTFMVPASPEERQPSTIDAWQYLRTTAFRYFLVAYPPRAEEFEDGIAFATQADGKEWSIEINVSVKCGAREPGNENSIGRDPGLESDSGTVAGIEPEDGSGSGQP